MHNSAGSERNERLAEMTSLTRSPTRFRILDLICESPHTQADLRRKLDIHRTTLRENLVELATKHWIEDVPSENVYRALPAGRIAVRSIHEAMVNFRTADRLGPFLAQLPEAPPIRADTFRTCDMTLCESNDPYAPMKRFVGLVQESNSFRGFAPVFNPMYVESLGSRVTDGHDFEIIGPPDVFESLRSGYPEVFETVLDVKSTRLLVSEELPQFGVALLDETAVIAVYDDDMRTHSLLEACDEQRELVEWAEQRYETERHAADEYEGLSEE